MFAVGWGASGFPELGPDLLLWIHPLYILGAIVFYFLFMLHSFTP